LGAKAGARTTHDERSTAAAALEPAADAALVGVKLVATSALDRKSWHYAALTARGIRRPAGLAVTNR